MPINAAPSIIGVPITNTGATDRTSYQPGTLPGVIVAFSIITARAPHRVTAAHTHYQVICRDRMKAKNMGHILGLIFSIFGAIIAGIAGIVRGEIFD